MPHPSLSQWFTPIWAAEALIEQFFPDLSPHDLVLEPTCGPGHFLQALRAIAPTTPALGIELDPHLARDAQQRSGYPVLIGDVRTLPIPVTPTVILGNPPFATAFVEALLQRAHTLLPDGGRVGLILPCYVFQTESRFLRYAAHWSMAQTLIPRTLFPNLRLPLLFAHFQKDQRRRMIGFTLYAETAAVRALPASTQAILQTGSHPGSVWRQAVEEALLALGGEATLTRLYRYLERRRPTPNIWWRQKIRQTVQRYCIRTGPARYACAA